MYLGQSDEQGFYATLATKPSMCVARKYPDPNHGANFNNCHPNPPSDHNLFCVMLRLTKQRNLSKSMTIRSFKNYSSERFDNLIIKFF